MAIVYLPHIKYRLPRLVYPSIWDNDKPSLALSALSLAHEYAGNQYGPATEGKDSRNYSPNSGSLTSPHALGILKKTVKNVKNVGRFIRGGIIINSAPGTLTSLMIVVSIAFLVPVILYKFRIQLPVVVAEIIVGLIIGKSGFHIAESDPWLDLLSLFGFIYLMFLSGLEIDISFFGKQRKRVTGSWNPLFVAGLVFGGILAVSFLLSLILVALGYVQKPFLMTLIIGTVSLGVVVPVLKEKRLLEHAIGQMILLVTVLGDFLTMMLLAIYVSTMARNKWQMVLLLLFFAAVFVIYLIIRRIASGRIFQALSRSTVQIGTRAVFALILLFVVLSESMGVDNILGAFMAGVIVSLLAPKKTFKHQLDSFGYGFLIPIFFVMVGARMDIWNLFTNWKLILLIPMLLVFLFAAKMLPVLILRFWFGWREVFGTGILISAKLSLVIAATTIALRLHLIDENLNGALILVAVLSSMIFPVWFNRMFPEREAPKPVIAIIGANHISLPVAKDLVREESQVQLYSESPPGDDQNYLDDERLHLNPVPELTYECLEQAGAFQADTIVMAGMDDDVNIRLARAARKAGVERIVLRVESPDKHQKLQEEAFTVFSTLYASRTLLKALIENPSAVRLITQDADTIREVTVSNPRYSDLALQYLPALGDVLVLRIYRGETYIVPHGNTEIRFGDRLLVTGQPEHIEALRSKLS